MNALEEAGIHNRGSLLIKDSLLSPGGFLISQIVHQSIFRGDKVSAANGFHSPSSK